jgi:SAM-dependent methyltransferase
MDLRKYNLSATDIQYFIDNTAGYQPYIIDEQRQVAGRGAWPPPTPQYKWFYDQKAKSNESQVRHWGPGHHMVLDYNNVDSTTWELMITHNNSLRSMFDDFISLAIQSTNAPTSVIEIGCNDGALLLLALEKGCKEAIGYDFEINHANIFKILSKITHNKIKFVHEGYNSLTHTMNCQPADIVIANAVMCHLSDPLHFIKYLSTITNKTLLISCGVHKGNTGEMTINFHGKPKHYGSSEFPDVFTHHTTISYDLFVYALKECGFKEIYEIEHNDTYPSKEWYYGQNNMGFIAVR